MNPCMLGYDPHKMSLGRVSLMLDEMLVLLSLMVWCGSASTEIHPQAS